MNLFETGNLTGKTVELSSSQLFVAWRKVRSAKGSGGIDGKSISKVEENLGKELYKLWSRMSSGSYHPQAVKAVSIPKWDGSARWLGVPTVVDRVAQQVVKDILEPRLEAVFHPNSYGYRPNKNTHQAIKRCTAECREKSWVIDLDIKGFFDNLDHDLLLKAVDKHVKEVWIRNYIIRWLKSPVYYGESEELKARDKGTPQGGVISPLLANLYLHYAFDAWMQIKYPQISFERYADDIVIHCSTKSQAELVLDQVKSRLKVCKLEVHPLKTKLVYCKNSWRRGKHDQITFDFLGFRFQPRKVSIPNANIYKLGYGPAISTRAKKHIVKSVRDTKFHRWTNRELPEIAQRLRLKLLGWLNYFGRYRKWSMHTVFRNINDRIVKWLMNKYKRYRNRVMLAREKLKAIAKDYPNLFEHWKQGFLPG